MKGAFDGGATLIVIRGGKETRFARPGIADLYGIISSGSGILDGATAIDKCIGKAAAALLVLGGAARAVTPLISTPARAMLEAAGTETVYGSETPCIMNRAGDGPCPMEALSGGTDDPAEIYRRIRDFMNGGKRKGGG